MRFSKNFIVVAALLGATIGLRATAQTRNGGNQPHGTTGVNTCDSACQGTELSALGGSLDTLIAGLPTSGYNTINNVDTRDLTNGALAQLIRQNITSSTPSTNATKVQCATWVAWAFAKMSTTVLNGDTNNINVLFTTNKDVSNNDVNATEFATIGLGAILNSHRLSMTDITSAATTQGWGSVSANIYTALSTLQDHTAAATVNLDIPSYTNIYAMNTAAMLLLGQALGNSTAVSTAEAQLHSYYTEISTNGIHEFDSPTYSGTQMEGLTMGYKYATNTNDRHNFKVALDYLWLDLATNFFSGSIKVAGPFSRDYDFRNGQGSLQSWIEVLGGWTTGTATTGTSILAPGGISLELAELLDIISGPTYYVVPTSSYLLATGNTSRSVYQYWGSPKNVDPGAIATTLPIRTVNMFQNAAIGCTSGNYGPQDKLFAAMLSGLLSDGTGNAGKANRGLALISNVLDSSGVPYGTLQVPDGSGHSKPEHMQENMVCGLENGAALLSTEFDIYNRDTGNDRGLSSNILFPVNTKNLTDATFPTVRVGTTLLSDLIAGSTCTWNNTTKSSATIFLCPLVMNSSIITITGVNGGVVGIKAVEATGAGGSPSTTANPNFAGLTASTYYNLELDLEGSQLNDGTPLNPGPPAKNAGASNGVGRIVINHANGTKGSQSALFTRVSYIVVASDDTTPDTTLSILGDAAFTDSNNVPVSGWRQFEVAFNNTGHGGYPGSPAVSNIYVDRSNANNAIQDPGSVNAAPAMPSFDPTQYVLSQISGGVTTNSSYTFWHNPSNAYIAP